MLVNTREYGQQQNERNSRLEYNTLQQTQPRTQQSQPNLRHSWHGHSGIHINHRLNNHALQGLDSKATPHQLHGHVKQHLDQIGFASDQKSNRNSRIDVAGRKEPNDRSHQKARCQATREIVTTVSRIYIQAESERE